MEMSKGVNFAWRLFRSNGYFPQFAQVAAIQLPVTTNWQPPQSKVSNSGSHQF
jgi:hypothetical protein